MGLVLVFVAVQLGNIDWSILKDLCRTDFLRPVVHGDGESQGSCAAEIIRGCWPNLLDVNKNHMAVMVHLPKMIYAQELEQCRHYEENVSAAAL